ncbi:MAG TPA: biotin/lipoyl-containing protein [Burkholderiaceae bacterium]|jgi:biotin carboxyl carrier protein
MAEPPIELHLDAPAWEGLEDDAEALLAQWDAAVGDAVAAGQEIGLAELVKASVPVVAPVAGRIVELCVAAGENFGRATVLARLGPP